MQTLFLGVDISTTGSKALLIDTQGAVLATATHPHTISTPRPLWSEQDPQEWWQAACLSIRQVLDIAGVKGEEVKAVGLTGQMHGLVLLDQSGAVLRPAILWNDQRTAAECEEITRVFGAEHLLAVTGNRALTGFTAPKILWVRHNEPQVYARTAHVLLPKDYVRYRLTGDFAVDKADGAGMLLFDLKQRTWSAELLKALDIPLEWLPTPYEGPQITGEISVEAAQLCGLTAGTPVVAGGGDQAAQAVGVGAVSTGIVALTLGTSGVVFAATPAPLIEPQGRVHAFCHAVPGMWHFMGVMLSAAGSLQWYRDALAPGVPFEVLMDEAAAVPPGSEGLQFLPYLSGERTPHPDPLARGAWIGLTLRHGRGHLTRALLEGVAYGLKDGFMLLQNAGLGPLQQVRASGGGTKSVLWRQILASVLDAELVTVNTTEGAAYGAALLAGVGSGCWADVQSACQAVISITGTTIPDPMQVSVYTHGYAIYQQLYPALKFSFQEMAEG